MNHPITLVSLRAAAAVVLALVVAAVHAPAFPHGLETPTYTSPSDGVPDRSRERFALRAELERLKAIQRRHEDRIMAVQGVHGMGIGRAPSRSRVPSL